MRWVGPSGGVGLRAVRDAAAAGRPVAPTRSPRPSPCPAPGIPPAITSPQNRPLPLQLRALRLALRRWHHANATSRSICYMLKHEAVSDVWATGAVDADGAGAEGGGGPLGEVGGSSSALPTARRIASNASGQAGDGAGGVSGGDGGATAGGVVRVWTVPGAVLGEVPVCVPRDGVATWER